MIFNYLMVTYGIILVLMDMWVCSGNGLWDVVLCKDF